MDIYQRDILNARVGEGEYLPPQLMLEDLQYSMTNATLGLSTSPMRQETFDAAILDFEDGITHPSHRSTSYSSLSSQSVSPISNAGQPLSDLLTMQMSDEMYANAMGQASPNMAMPSRKDSDDESYRAERRRAQNRAAQRAYRQRKDHSLKQREKEIDSLRDELEKAQRLNKTLCKVVALLRERLKSSPMEDDKPGGE